MGWNHIFRFNFWRNQCFAGEFVATSRKGGASSISSAGLGFHMADLQPSKTKSLRVAKHRPRQTSCLVNAIHHKPSRKAITLYMCTLQPFPCRHKFVQSHWWQHQTFSSVYEPKHINMIKGRGNAGFRSSTLKLDSCIQGIATAFTVHLLQTDAIEANKVSDPFMHQIRYNIARLACNCSKVATHQHH